MQGERPPASDSSASVEVVSYAPRVPSRSGRQWVYRTLIAGAAIFLLIFVNLNIDFGWVEDVCTQCGATRSGRHLYFFNFGGEYGWRVSQNSISKLIEASEGRMCSHQWVTAARGERWCRATYRGRHPWYEINMLERTPGFSKWLSLKVQSDPQFIGRLRKMVRSPDRDNDVWNDLLDHVLRETEPEPAESQNGQVPGH